MECRRALRSVGGYQSQQRSPGTRRCLLLEVDGRGRSAGYVDQRTHMLRVASLHTRIRSARSQEPSTQATHILPYFRAVEVVSL